MDVRAASDNLQVIRTLMERAALYRRALAPIMLTAGILGVAAATLGILLHVDSSKSFGTLWLSTAGVGVISAFLLARRQALKDHEPFWSPPTRRVAQALFPALTSGLCVGLGLIVYLGDAVGRVNLLVAILWMMCYGCASHAAGFFMVRGIRLLGWIFIIGACALIGYWTLSGTELRASSAHLVMGSFFGLLQLVYGGYLYATEKRKNAA